MLLRVVLRVARSALGKRGVAETQASSRKQRGQAGPKGTEAARAPPPFARCQKVAPSASTALGPQLPVPPQSLLLRLVSV